ncbi:RagB/SusD family nutrient uptake outer membrane protein [Niabella drilacis]|uniref:Starch-binding associating with outer membrane n=1 Tax=Niabella drilacis (strain DSM 25811 / CCM 8410 / CCUG 62505 / LMG 26954 / E90) TaxID=1285928 RepID=A0A1G6R8V5_NIADE|nr:RagB/SusD family nutrient uptake outer membrane protein [Niabella drilacis]SDD01052.1 Starch-binding associating with outer membrane [Niabella drilacis]
MKPYNILILLLMFFFAGCGKELNVPSRHQVPENNMWQQRNDARSAVFATYGLMRAALANENAFFAYGELRAGNFRATSRADIGAVTTQQLNANFATLEEWKDWRRFYAVIAQANLCLQKLPQVLEKDFRYNEQKMKVDIASVRFLRALAYFYIVRIWGDAPLITDAVEGGFTSRPRDPQTKILDFVEQELIAASVNLPWNYDGSQPEQIGVYYDQAGSFWLSCIASKAACYAMLAHVYAWRGDYASCESNARLVYENTSLGKYTFTSASTLTAETAGVFSALGNGVIFSLTADARYQESSAKGHIEDWTLSAPLVDKPVPDVYVPADSVLQIFNEANDQRFAISVAGAVSGGYFQNFSNPVPMFSKIKARTYTQEPLFNNFQSAIVITRYEDIVLLRAEALYYLNDINNAMVYLNAVRTRRGLAEFKLQTGGNLLDAILKERQRELLGEGQRWFDLVRNRKAHLYSGLSIAQIGQGAALWPLSKNTLLNNGSLQQNSYWK